MKKIISAVLVICFIFSGALFVYADSPLEDISSKVKTDVSPLYEINGCKLLVNGKEITGYGEYIKIYTDNDGFTDAQIPLFSVIKALGGRFIWIGKNAIIFCKTGIYFYDSENEFLSRLPYFGAVVPEKYRAYMSFFNLLENPYAGGKGVYDSFTLDKELIVNEYNILLLKSAFGFRIQKDITNKTIIIEDNPLNERILNVLKTACK